MFSSTLRRLATPAFAAGAALAVMIGAGAGVAAAADPPSSNTGIVDNLNYSKTVVGPAVLHPGDTVTYKSEISFRGGLERSIAKIRDIPPAGFVLQSAKATYLGVTTRASITNESDGGVSAKCTSGCTFLVGGFVVKGGQPVTLEATYKVPDTFAFGTYDSGLLFDVNAFTTQSGQNPFNVNVQVVDPNVTTATTLQAPASAKTGESVTLTATVDPTNAAGQVQFKDGDNNIGSPVTPVNGVATLPHTFDTVGPHSISAVFTAGAGFHNSTSTAHTVDVTADTTTTLQASPNPALVGQDVTVTATVTPASAAGHVQFKVDGANYGEPVAVSNGTASITRTFPEASAHSFTADFVGTGGYNNSAASSADFTVNNPDWSTTTIVVEPVSAEAGSPTNLMATVRPIPTGGEVVFRVDGTEVGRADVGTADGVAVLEHTFDTAGSYQVVAEFTGTEGFGASTSAEFTATVAPAAPVLTAVNADLKVQGLSVVGQTVTLTVDVDPADAQGTVQFYKGTEAIGGPVAVVDGKATITTALDSEGTQVLSAKFLGGEGFRDTVSNPVVLNVSAAPENPGTGAGSLGSLSGLFTGSLGS
ncbi:Ig-like domain-containing protein [Rhodococcus sp. AG1013]|uniref:Ig-like domain-containing protein n=1 Tax=Rhodococcus sp. AG1013 TaxID=2183996 RepID=UPI000E2CD8C2|nr:Ig-like domain-containing protein [Rhodococcus sp. AG1013]RDI30622.1 Ig-like domain-containing protein [Rhodococcus sp. AG1013]